MRTTKRISLPLLLILLLGVFACIVPGIPQIDQNAAGTAVQQTLSAIIKQTEDAGQSIVDVSSDTPEATFTAFPTFTPMATSTPTLVPTSTLTVTPVPSWTPTFPMISVSVATNCRLGPGKVYQLVGGLPAGEWVRVYARDPGEDYWYIRNPDKPSQFCWVWGEYATVIGPVGGLAIYTPPPSPTPTMTSTPAPDFDASYSGLQSCNGKFWADIKLKNTGTGTFRSVSMTLTDTVTKAVKTTIKDGFTDLTGCNSTTKDTLAPGKTVIASSPAFAYNPGGHKINASITLCTATGLNGYCVTLKMTFKP